MSESTACLKPYCDNDAVGLYGIDLCGQHAIKLWMAVERLSRDPVEIDMKAIRASVVARRDAEDLRRQRAALANLPMAAPPVDERRPEWVYFVRFADRVKIGYTTKLPDRLAAIPHDEVLVVIPGGYQDEQALHRRFAHLRVTGEWFKAEDDLMTYVAEQVAEHGHDITPHEGAGVPTAIRPRRSPTRRIA